MYVAWVLNHRARPETVALKVEAKDLFQLERACEAISQSDEFPPDSYTIVHGCMAAPLNIKDPS